MLGLAPTCSSNDFNLKGFRIKYEIDWLCYRDRIEETGVYDVAVRNRKNMWIM